MSHVRKPHRIEVLTQRIRQRDAKPDDVFEWMQETGCNGMMQNEIFAKAIMILKKEIKEKKGLE